MDIYNPTKTCSKCGIDKPHSEYHKCSRVKSGLQPKCKSCRSQYAKDNSSNICQKHREYYELNPDKMEKQKLYWKEYGKGRNEYHRNYQSNRRKSDPLYKLKSTISHRIRSSIKSKGYKKSNKTQDILGCSFIEFKEHIQSQFTEEMNWDNHGTYWDIDHIIPISVAKNEEEVLRLNHYTNLQPLNSYYNRYIKRGKI